MPSGNKPLTSRVNVDPDLCHHLVSLGHNELNDISAAFAVSVSRSDKKCKNIFAFPPNCSGFGLVQGAHFYPVIFLIHSLSSPSGNLTLVLLNSYHTGVLRWSAPANSSSPTMSTCCQRKNKLTESHSTSGNRVEAKRRWDNCPVSLCIWFF